MGAACLSTLSGKGVGKSCLIIGGGTSVLDLNYSLIESIEDVWAVNVIKHPIQQKDVNYLIYNDQSAREKVKNMSIDNHITVISNSKAQCNRVNIAYGDAFIRRLFSKTKEFEDTGTSTGMKCVAICAFLMRYDKVFLIGFDYYTSEKEGEIAMHYHPDSEYYPSDRVLQTQSKRMKQHLLDWDCVDWSSAPVYNLNKDSALRVFPFAQ